MDSAVRMTVVVTRSEAHDGPLTSMLKDRGATVIHWPTIRHEGPDDPVVFERTLSRLSDYQWIVFSSPRAVASVARCLVGPPLRLKVAAVGNGTAASLEAAGWPVHLVAEDGTAESLVEAFTGLQAGNEPKGSVFFPASSIARQTIPLGLESLGYRVQQVTAYTTIDAKLDRQECLVQLKECRPDAVTFASPSAVEALHRILGADEFERILSDCPAIAIGPVTAEALKKLGFPAAEIATEHTLSGLVDAVESTVDRLKNTSRRLFNAVSDTPPSSSSP